MSDQVYLDAPSDEAATPSERPARRSSRINTLQRALLMWLIEQRVDGLALKVPTRVSRYRADLAAFWNRARRQGSGRDGPWNLLTPCQTIVIECRTDRDHCWPDCANSEDLLPRLRSLKQEVETLEEGIRHQEPQLRETAVLFEEFSEWDYGSSENQDYHKASQEIQCIEEALYHGTRFETIRRAHLADSLYLAVPSQAVHPHEVAAGWGLLWVKADGRIEVVMPSPEKPCPPENRFHLVQNIAAAASDDVLCRRGILLARGKYVTGPVPRSRRG